MMTSILKKIQQFEKAKAESLANPRDIRNCKYLILDGISYAQFVDETTKLNNSTPHFEDDDEYNPEEMLSTIDNYNGIYNVYIVAVSHDIKDRIIDIR